MKSYRIHVHAVGPGSGHVSRVNAIRKGFERLNVPVQLSAALGATKYRHILDPRVRVIETVDPGDVLDLFICDWRPDRYVLTLPASQARCWVGLRRLSSLDITFPRHFVTIAIEPDVSGDYVVWPIIATWFDELASPARLAELVGCDLAVAVGLICQNGNGIQDLTRLRVFATDSNVIWHEATNGTQGCPGRVIDYYPIAEFFASAEAVVVGGGYNSVHEVLSYADPETTTVVAVGGDDQVLRATKWRSWEKGRGSHAHELAALLVSLAS